MRGLAPGLARANVSASELHIGLACVHKPAIWTSRNLTIKWLHCLRPYTSLCKERLASCNCCSIAYTDIGAKGRCRSSAELATLARICQVRWPTSTAGSKTLRSSRCSICKNCWCSAHCHHQVSGCGVLRLGAWKEPRGPEALELQDLLEDLLDSKNARVGQVNDIAAASGSAALCWPGVQNPLRGPGMATWPQPPKAWGQGLGARGSSYMGQRPSIQCHRNRSSPAALTPTSLPLVMRSLSTMLHSS